MEITNVNFADIDEDTNDFFTETVCNSNMLENYVPKAQTPPEVEYHERMSLIDAIKAELSEDTVEFLDMLISCPKEFFILFCTKAGKPTQASITKTCKRFGLSNKKVRRYFAELQAYVSAFVRK